jgi:hypothetical protein
MPFLICWFYISLFCSLLGFIIYLPIAFIVSYFFPRGLFSPRKFVGAKRDVSIDDTDDKIMEKVMEVDGSKIRILALSKSGVWLPLAEVRVTEEIFQAHRVPLLIKIEELEDKDPS